MRQTAWAVIASSRPIAPWPSPLLTLMLIRAGSTPIALARAPFMALRCGPSLGAWALMTASTLTTRRSEEHTSELQSRLHLVCRLLLEKKKKYLTDRRNPLGKAGAWSQL